MEISIGGAPLKENEVQDGSEDFVITSLPESGNKHTPSYLGL